MRKLAFCILCLGLLFVAEAKADERFSVEIKVDVTDDNASVAREKAMNSANRAAITAVARRISTTEGANRIAGMTDAQLINFIKETSVVNEKNSDIRYMADLRIVINEDLLKEYMKEREIPLVGQNTASILVIPLFREFSDDAPKLWEADNPWKQAWDNAANSSAIRFVSISNSAGNLAALDATSAADANTDALEKVNQMAGTNDVYVLDASYNGVEGLDITAVSLSGNRQNIKVAGAKSSGAELFNQAVIETKAQLERQILSDGAIAGAKQNEMTILYPFPSLGQWITAEQKIKALDEVSQMEVQAMAPGKAQFKIWYTGDLSSLQRQLKIKGYLLEDGGNYMILKNTGE